MWTIKVKARDGSIRIFRTLASEEGAIQIATMLAGRGEETAIQCPDGELYLV